MNQSKLVNYIVAWESGELDDDKTIELFQHLVDTGKAWTLQGFYGRTAIAMIEEGLVIPPGKKKPAEVNTEPARPKKKRGRKSTKQVGALVSMSQRRTKGQGIILERLEDVPHSGHDTYGGIMTRMKQMGHVGWGVYESEHHNFVLVQWFDRPSEYNSEKSWYTRQWYPDKWVKVISPVTKMYHEKAENKKN